MSDVEGTSRSRPATRSQATSRDSSRASSVGKAESKAKDKSKIKGILRKTADPKGSKSKSRSRSRSRSPATSLSSVASSEVEKGREAADEEESDADGLSNILKNLHHGTHVALTDKSDDVKTRADKLIKRDAGKNLSEALKKERLKGAQMFAALLGRGSAEDQDVPHFKAFNKRKPPCPQEVFDKHLAMFIRQFSRFSGKSPEFLYFLIELDALRRTANLSDEQTQRILQNRLAGRFQSYFMTELRREGDIVKVLNRLGRDYVDSIDSAAEVEKCVNFKLKFHDTAEELVRLKEIMSFAYPHMSREVLRQNYIQKVVELIPKEARHALIDDFEQQRALEKQGFAPLTDFEVDAKILKHCRAYERRQPAKQIFKVTAKNDERPNGESRPVNYASSEALSEENFVGQEKKGKSGNQLDKIFKSVKQIQKRVGRQADSGEWQMIGQVNGQPEGTPNNAGHDQGQGNPKGGMGYHPFQNQTNAAQPQKGFTGNGNRPTYQQNWQPRPSGPPQQQRGPRPPFQQQQGQNRPYNNNWRGNQRPQNPYYSNDRGQRIREPYNRPGQGQNGGPGKKSEVILASQSDPRYPDMVKEARETQQLKYLGEKIRNDVRNASENFRQVLSQTRAGRPRGQEIYTWNEGRYNVDNCPKIEGPIFRKVGNRTPDLTVEVLKRFASCCHACGFRECPGKGRKGEGPFKCAYHDKPDSWYPCSKCLRGFHLPKDCLADVKN